MQTTEKRLNAKYRNGCEIHFDEKETGVKHLNSIPIYFVATLHVVVMSSLPLCLYALLFPAASYKTGSTLIVDLNKNGNCRLCPVRV